MNKTNTITSQVAGKIKRLAGEVLGDQKLHEEGKAQEDESRNESEESGSTKPFGNLDRLT